MKTARRTRCRRRRRRRLERRRRRYADAAVTVTWTLGEMTRAETTDFRAALLRLLEEQR